jgi:hypothetical protein
VVEEASSSRYFVASGCERDTSKCGSAPRFIDKEHVLVARRGTKTVIKQPKFCVQVNSS